MLVLEITTNADYVAQRLGQMSKKAPMVIRGGINDTAKQAKKQDESITKKMYTDKGDINSLKYTAATTGNLTAWLRDSGTNVSMTHYNHYTGKRVGASAIINTSHGRKTLKKYGNKAFAVSFGIAVRKTKSRLPIEKMASISSPVQHGNEQTWGSIKDEVRQRLNDNIAKRLEAVL